MYMNTIILTVIASMATVYASPGSGMSDKPEIKIKRHGTYQMLSCKVAETWISSVALNSSFLATLSAVKLCPPKKPVPTFQLSILTLTGY
jgi:hypothetical protein